MAPELQDGVIAATDHPVKLPVFEGPLDLLLYLIRRDELDIYDIPIAQVTEQYLTVLRKMEKLNLEVAGDFFVMAATLMHLKSRVLIPRDRLSRRQDEENENADDPDPRWELVQQLLDYKRFKEAAQELDKRAFDAAHRLARDVQQPPRAPEDLPPLKSLSGMELWDQFNTVLRRLQEKLQVGHIEADRVTVADEMSRLVTYGRSLGWFAFEDYFEEEKVSFMRIVAAFLACLELSRTGILQLRQDSLESGLMILVEEESAEAEAVE